MNERQFMALAELARVGWRDEDAQSLHAARSMMVDGVSARKAARLHGITHAVTMRVRARMNDTLRVARVALGIE